MGNIKEWALTAGSVGVTHGMFVIPITSYLYETSTERDENESLFSAMCKRSFNYGTSGCGLSRSSVGVDRRLTDERRGR